MCRGAILLHDAWGTSPENTSVGTFDSDTFEASRHPRRCLIPVNRSSCPFGCSGGIACIPYAKLYTCRVGRIVKNTLVSSILWSRIIYCINEGIMIRDGEPYRDAMSARGCHRHSRRFGFRSSRWCTCGIRSRRDRECILLPVQRCHRVVLRP